MPKKYWLILCLTFLILSLSAAVFTSQNAALASTTILVNTTNDELNNDSDCSLREALIAANSDTVTSGCTAGSGDDTIQIDVTGMVWPIEPLPDITSNLSIVGPGYEEFGIRSDQTPTLQVVGTHTVSITGINITADSGISENEVFRNDGGTVTLNEVHFSDTTGSSITIIHNTGTIEILNSVVLNSGYTENSQSIWSSGSLTLINTYADTRVRLVGATATVLNSTLPILDNDGGIANIQNSVVSGCNITSGGTVNSLGHNLDTISGCGFSAATNDLTNGLNPKIVSQTRTTTNYALHVTTLALLPDSPLIDAGDNALCTGAQVNNRDYRGQTRPLDGNGDSSSVCDVGAVEFQLNNLPSSEYDALVALYNSANGTSWGPSAGWLVLPNACQWGGVVCADDHVSELYLQFDNLEGTIPPEIANLTQLKRLYLRFASIPAVVGDLTSLEFLNIKVSSDPPQLSSIPPEIGSLSNLRYLLITGMLTGTIPPEIANLSNLEYLTLSNTCYFCEGAGLVGEIPPEIGDLTNLKWLELWANNLTGSVPPELGNLVNLQVLHIVGMPLTGTLPPELGNLSSVVEFWLYDTDISGPIPPEFGNLSNVRIIILADNQLTGEIPIEITELPNLLGIALDRNQLTGNIPPQFGSTPHLRELGLQYNQLSGTIPSQLGNATGLFSLNLHDNRLSGSIPSELGNLTNLRSLQLQNNQLSGEIPLSITSLVNLLPDPSEPFDEWGTDFGYNMLTSNIQAVKDFLAIKDPDWASTQTVPPANVTKGTVTSQAIMLNWTPIAYTEPPGYYEVWYSLNAAGPFSLHGVTANKSASSYNAGSLLLGTTYHFKVRTVTPIHDSQQNLLQSVFSPVVSGKTSTSSNFCSSVSQIPPAECQALVALYNSTNGPGWANRTGWLSSTTPCSWYGITCSAGRVTVIQLWSNQLSGTLPSSISNLTKLQALRLDDNQLSGIIPTSIGSLTQLVELRLPRNQLVGPIPSTIGNLSALEQLALYSNSLSGAIPASIGNLSNLLFIDASFNQLTGSLPPEMGNLANLQFLLFGENQLSGPIPPEFGNMTNLYYVWLVDNQLSGAIPSTIEGWTNVWLLRLDENQLTGSIPPQIGNLTNLFEFGVSNNRLTGPIPPEIGNLANLQRLWVQNNQLSGEIPSQVTNLVLLNSVEDVVDLGFNALYSNNPDVVNFLDSKDPDWAATQTIAPSDVQVVDAGVNSIELAWTPIPYTGDGGRYQIWYSTNETGPFSLHGSTPNKFATGYTAGGLQPNITYYLVVRTFTPAHGQQQNDITSGDSSKVFGTTDGAGLNAPSSLNVISSSQTDTDLSWNDHSTDEDSFSIERSPDGLTGWLPLVTVPANTTAYTDSGLNCSTTYFYRVRGYRSSDALFSAFTNVASATTYLCPPPGTPGDVTATGVSVTQIDVTWTDTASDEDSFHIERSTDGMNNWQEVGSVGADVTTFANTGLLCNRQFFYRVRSFRASDNQYSFYSNTASGSTQPCLPPNAPTLMSAVGEGTNRVTLTWQDNSLDESGFSVEMRPDGGSDFTRIAIVPANQTTYTHEGLSCGTTYEFQVRAYRSSDGQYSLPSVMLDGTTLGCPPPVPHTAGLYQNGAWLFRDTNATGLPDVAFVFGPREAGWTPLVGDWDGDGVDSIGLYKDGLWMLRNSASSGQRDLAFKFNPLGAGALPVVGDWNGDGVDTIGLYKDGLWVIRNSSSAGPHDLAFTFNPGGTGWQPLAGDWNGDQYDTVGLYRDGRWYLIDVLQTVTVASGFKFGPPQPGWTAIVGDWNVDGLDTIGLYRDGVWRLRNSNDEGGVDVGFTFLPGAKGWLPVAGYRGGMAGLSSLDLGSDLTINPTPLPVLPTAETVTPEVSDTVAPEVTESLIVPSETPTPSEETIIPPPTEVVTEVTPTPTATPTETLMPEMTDSP